MPVIYTVKMGFWSQYRALMFKNWILWKRKLFGSLCELLFPIGLMIVVYLIRTVNEPTSKLGQTFADESSKTVFVTPDISIYHAIRPPFTECFSVGDGTTAKLSYGIVSNVPGFSTYFTQKMSEFSINNQHIAPYYKTFASESDLENYVTGSSYDNNQKMCFAVIFNSQGSSYEVNIRFNTTNPLPSGRKRLGDFIDIFNFNFYTATDTLVVSPSVFLGQFYDYGFIEVSNIVDNFILTSILNKPSGKIESEIKPMRFPKYIDDTFLTALEAILPFFIIISFLIPTCRLLSAIVMDKETKTKEIMMMMGMSNLAYWLSWVTYYLIIYTIIAIFLTIIAKGGDVFIYSNPGMIFLYFWVYGIACIAFSVFLSTFFSKSRSALLLGVPIFIGSWFVSFAVSDVSVSANKKAGSSLLPNVAFELATINLCLLETGQTGFQTNNSGTTYQNYSFEIYIGMLLLDILYMSVLTWYLEMVWPSEWGVKHPWYFFVTKTFWCPRRIKSTNHLFEEEVNWGNAVEPVDPNLESQKAAGKAMIVRNLTKHFDNKVAVEKLNLDIYENQIFALLGHNGAGKTTTLSMLTGLIPPTDGDMTMKGMYLSKDLSEIRSQLGVCPQHNVLFPILTPMEHLYLFCVYKGVTDSKKIEEMSNKILGELELLPQAKKEVRFLSGGQKRKLSLAIALIGDSPVVLLDEPTAGMDLTARRHMWDMLKRNTNGKIIILTTHYMEEADVLADRIAIMSAGSLRCCGSSMFLKTKYGVGYYLTMVKHQDAIRNSTKIEEFVKHYITGSKLMADHHGEITFQLPNSSSHEFVKFFEDLDKDMASLGLLSYSISATTLEEVFLRVARGDDVLEKKTVDENVPLLDDGFVLKRDRDPKNLAWRHFVALTKKRYLATKRDMKVIIFEICIPIVLIIIGLALMLIPSFLVNYGAYDLQISAYSTTQTILYGGTADGSSYVSSLSGIKPLNTGIKDLQTFSNYVFNNNNTSPDPNHMGAYFFNQIDTVNGIYSFDTYINQTAFQSAPTFYGAMSAAIFQSIRPGFSILYTNHPLPITAEMNTVSNNGDGFLGSLIFSLGFSFIPTGIILFISKEREINIKHQHMISGVSLFAY